jgi:hypothetical protein
MFVNHIIIIHYMILQHYIWLVFYVLLLMAIRWKVPCQILNDCLSFATCPLQLRDFSRIMSSMTTKSVIYGVIDYFLNYSVCSETQNIELNMRLLSHNVTIITFLILKLKKIKLLFFGTYFLFTLHVFYINPHYKTNSIWNK